MLLFPASPPALLKKVFRGLVWNMSAKAKKIYLTFDDGPIPEVTPYVLKILKHYNAKATFFCIGDNVRKHPDLFRTIINEGHQIGNHTQQHLDGWKVKPKEYLSNIKQAALTFHQSCKALSEPDGKKLFRPPYGKISPRLARHIKKLGYTIIMWDVLSFDWRQEKKPEWCLKTVLAHTKPGSIIVFHDSKKAYHNMAYTLPKVLAHFSEKGFTFEHL